jgi:hypothetical protein
MLQNNPPHAAANGDITVERDHRLQVMDEVEVQVQQER